MIPDTALDDLRDSARVSCRRKILVADLLCGAIMADAAPKRREPPAPEFREAAE